VPPATAAQEQYKQQQSSREHVRVV